MSNIITDKLSALKRGWTSSNLSSEEDASTRCSPSSDKQQRDSLLSQDVASVSSDTLDAPLLESQAKLDVGVTYRSSLFVVFPAFAAYACMFSLQHEVKVIYGIADDASPASHLFSMATASVFAYKLLFRFLHSFAFGRFTPRGRLYIGMGCLAVAISVLCGVAAGFLPTLPCLLFVAYGFAGVGMGTFEGNVLSSFTFLGPSTKKYAVMGMPFGVGLITVGGFVLRYFGVPLYAIFVAVLIGIGISAIVLHVSIPCEPVVCSSMDTPEISRRQSIVFAAHHFDAWWPVMWSRCVTGLVDLAILELFSPGLLLFVYDTPQLLLITPPMWSHAVWISKDMFFACYNLCTASSSLLGRSVAFRMRNLVHPIWFVILMALGAALIILSVPGHCLNSFGLMLTPLGGCMVLFGDAFIYVTTCRFIDERISKENSTAAISCWLFASDLGSNVGANSIAYLRDLVTR